jgi:hypothetical protein
MLRIYDTELIDRLNKRFNDSGSRYEHRNHFLTDLIETGLNRREYELSFKDKLLLNETETYKSIDAFAERFMEFERYVRTQFQVSGAADSLVKTILSNLYYLAQAQNIGIKLSGEMLKDGRYDELPKRFKQFEEIAGRVRIKDE